ncbi:MAG: hypothetical protein IKE22_05835 [Atopobiaceae bacterium]|nr:hypothetical protein [Atopobiaceae bacterium]
MGQNVRKRAIVAAIAVALIFLGVAIGGQGTFAANQQGDVAQTTQGAQPSATDATASDAPADGFYHPGDAYKLEQVVVLSRHNIRSPMSGTGSALAMATPHEWFAWTSKPSELSLRGGALETLMGQYFRLWLESEGLIPENYQPTADEARFYANAKQRTIATTQYFSSGMLPVANVRIETHAPYDEMDPVFTPQITFLSDSYEEAALAEIASTYGGGIMAGVAADLAEPYATLAEIVDYTESEGYQNGTLTDFDTTDMQVDLVLGEEPIGAGSLKTANVLVDALVLQYYEEADPLVATFGHEVSDQQWAQIGQLKKTYFDALYSSPLVATNIAHALLQTIASELDTDGRVFSFLCGHDSNIASVTGALGVEDYQLPFAIENKTPIGAKLVFERWSDETGQQFGRLRLVYNSVDQLRNLSIRSAQNPPMSYDLTLSGLAKNDDGLYAYDDLRARIQESIDAYDQLLEAYPDVEMLPAAA